MKRTGSIVEYKGETYKIERVKHDYLGVGYFLRSQDGKLIHVDSRISHLIKEAV